jgi:beta-1,4-N-acetylglucosaminyltransferase
MSQASKGCFVTVGATAPFNELVVAALSPKFLSALQAAGYTRLVIQYGQAKSSKKAYLTSLKRVETELGELPLHVQGFPLELVDFRETIKDVVCTPNSGLLIAHAGESVLGTNA